MTVRNKSLSPDLSFSLTYFGFTRTCPGATAIHPKGNNNTREDLNQGLRISYKHQDQNPKVLVLRLKIFPINLKKKRLNLRALYY